MTIEHQIATFAIQSILYEAACYPKPGLVTPLSNGAHYDMSYFTFLNSTAAISGYFEQWVTLGQRQCTPKEAFVNMRALGIHAEKAMFESTQGVNTHKGMIFLMGIATTACSYAHRHKIPFQEIPQLIQKMTEGIIEDDFKNLASKKTLTHGERLYLDYGITGVRGEAQNGMPTVFKHGLPTYEATHDLDQNSRLVHTLMTLISVCDDTTILHRHSMSTLNEVKALATHFIKQGGMRQENPHESLQALEDMFILKHISPGGSADLLAVTVFFERIKLLFKKL